MRRSLRRDECPGGAAALPPARRPFRQRARSSLPHSPAAGRAPGIRPHPGSGGRRPSRQVPRVLPPVGTAFRFSQSLIADVADRQGGRCSSPRWTRRPASACPPPGRGRAARARIALPHCPRSRFLLVKPIVGDISIRNGKSLESRLPIAPAYLPSHLRNRVAGNSPEGHTSSQPQATGNGDSMMTASPADRRSGRGCPWRLAGRVLGRRRRPHPDRRSRPRARWPTGSPAPGGQPRPSTRAGRVRPRPGRDSQCWALAIGHAPAGRGHVVSFAHRPGGTRRPDDAPTCAKRYAGSG